MMTLSTSSVGSPSVRMMMFSGLGVAVGVGMDVDEVAYAGVCLDMCLGVDMGSCA